MAARGAGVLGAAARLFVVTMLLFGVAPASAEDDERQQAAESSFDAVMQGNEVKGELHALGYAAPRAAPATTAPVGNATPTQGDTPAADGAVEVPLDRYEAVRARIAAARTEAARSYTTLVVLGASTYTGRSVEGGLALHLQLQATLRGPGYWKSVPLVGDEVAVVSARVGQAPIALTNQSGYQVWVTDQVGEVTLDLDLLVPARGPRGSLEYDFLVARTPVTRFDCTFPDAGLEPKLQSAVRADVTAEAGGTRLSAWLEPTSRIHLVGFKDLGAEDGRAAKVYVEALSLLSVEESSADLFAVLRYAILDAGTRQFDILVPPGLTVVSADGAGAFRYTLEPTADGTVIHGETAFPIRDAYEVSLRLSRPVESGVPLDVQLPRALGVEREHGWLGVEVLGAIQLEEVDRTEALAVDVGQLPAELVGNAVSPVLKGWRYHTDGAHVRLTATRLPEREPAAGSVDEVVATTTIAAEGRARTELRITLRNRLRHSLRLRLPPGVEVRGSELDGEPVTPSRDAEGAVLLPLKRSAGTDRPAPFTLLLSLEGDVGSLGLFGLPTLELPALELPVSTLRWDVIVPAVNRYTRLYGDVAPQGESGGAGAPAADQIALRYTRYWIGADRPVQVRFGYLRGWLRTPLGLLGALGVVAALATARRRWEIWTAATRLRAGMALALGAGTLGWLGGTFPLVLAGIGAAVIFAGADLRGAWDTWQRPVEAAPRPGSWRAGGVGRRLVLLVGTGFVGLVLLLAAARFVAVLGNPWG
jgi:hypothetical protein